MRTAKHLKHDTTPFFPVLEAETARAKSEHDRLQAWLKASKGSKDYMDIVFQGVKAFALKRQNLQPLNVVNA